MARHRVGGLESPVRVIDPHVAGGRAAVQHLVPRLRKAALYLFFELVSRMVRS
ncbi:hypothetical protein SDC9_127453 [bioreactor metagenome]|uniref:Uncharacterized protein n=1 Tax=bioreactor metagenome TaxID=1076179 RepID=A0A645CTH5_9ZZZZ